MTSERLHELTLSWIGICLAMGSSLYTALQTAALLVKDFEEGASAKGEKT